MNKISIRIIEKDIFSKTESTTSISYCSRHVFRVNATMTHEKRNRSEFVNSMLSIWKRHNIFQRETPMTNERNETIPRNRQKTRASHQSKLIEKGVDHLAKYLFRQKNKWKMKYEQMAVTSFSIKKNSSPYRKRNPPNKKKMGATKIKKGKLRKKKEQEEKWERRGPSRSEWRIIMRFFRPNMEPH